jgi:Mrp family chromosome partitioning ATPase
VDGVVMIVRGSYTSARVARHGLDQLKQRRAHILGLIFNRARASANGYQGYRQYRREYQWRPELAKQIA